jgi:excisionase family DNA binding protein
MSQVIPLGPGARMLTTREAAVRLGVSLRTIQLWVEADILPAARTPGGHRRIPNNAVEALALSTGLGGEPQTKRAAEAGTAPAVAPAVAPEEGPAPFDVLLVADDADWQTRCEQAVGPYGQAVTMRFAETGYLALLQIGQKAPDLLITNLDLPGMDGMAMLHTLERCESIAHMRILLLTDCSDHELARRGGVPLCAEVLKLPVTPEALAVRVGRWLLGMRVSL